MSARRTPAEQQASSVPAGGAREDVNGVRSRRRATAKRGDRRQQILDAAATIFCEKGYDATGLQEIADAVGILKGSLYHYIDTKEDLLFQIILRSHESSQLAVTRWKSIEGDAIAKIGAFVEDHVRASIADLTYTTVFFRDFRSLGDARKQEIIAARDAYERNLRELIRLGQKEGVIREEVDPRLGTLAIFGMVNLIYNWYRPYGPMKPDAVAHGLADMAQASLRA